jgi:hypothetical protein
MDGDGDAAGTGQKSARQDVEAVSAAGIPAACDLIPRAEIERLAGPLDGEPKREEKGCWYYVAMDTTSAEWKQLRERAERARAHGMDERAIELYHSTRRGLYVEVDLLAEGDSQPRNGRTAPPEEWDQTRTSSRGTIFHGRAGHVSVALRLQQLRIPPDTLAAVASRVRDRIPDGPIAHPDADPSQPPPPGEHPCSVLTREEAEAVLGRLVAAPFRTRERTPLADPAGKSCAYLTAGHRAFVLTPTWDYGAIDLKASRMVGGLVRTVADLHGIEGDTLEGAWDDAVVDLTGELLLLKGAHSLGIRYRASSTDAAGAIGLAGPALQRLAAADARLDK